MLLDMFKNLKCPPLQIFGGYKDVQITTNNQQMSPQASTSLLKTTVSSRIKHVLQT